MVNKPLIRPAICWVIHRLGGGRLTCHKGTVSWVLPPPSNSDRQDHYIFNSKSFYKPSFATVTGRGPHLNSMFFLLSTSDTRLLKTGLQSCPVGCCHSASQLVFLAAQLQFLSVGKKTKKKQQVDTLPETNSSPLKMDGWNTILSYWVSAYF